MPSGVPFLQSLAAGLAAKLGDDLPRALVFLPTRRAVRALGDAFVEHAVGQGDGVALLPRMRPLADIDPEEPPFEPGELVGLINPAIPSAQRRFDMAKIIARYHENISDIPLTPTGALSIADQLLSIMDDAAMEEVNLASGERLEAIRARASEHYQNAAKLYEIIQTYWPEYLAAQNMMEPMARRVALLNALTEHWTAAPPDYPVIIAGSTGTLKATAKLMHCVARLKDSAIILPGIDRNLQTAVWDNVTEQHPQFSLKRLIAKIGIELADIKDWSPVADSKTMRARRRVLSEALMPADSTDDWPGRIAKIKSEVSGNPFEDAFKGLSIIEAPSHDSEALSIALIMRDTLETPKATAALVTPDPALARRVKAKLRRWQVEVDYSQGEPLEETQLGAYLGGLLRLALDPENPVDLAFIAKHPLTHFGAASGELGAKWQQLERIALRGPRKSLANLYANQDRLRSDADKDAVVYLQPFGACIAEFAAQPEQLAGDWARSLAVLAEQLTQNGAKDNSEAQQSLLWSGDAGEKAAQIITSLMNHSEPLGMMGAREFCDLFASLMRGKVVRPRYGMHPRLQILGPLEARMLEADIVILGGLNEGVWPAPPASQPFLSPAMRRALGLSLPDRRFGLQAHDFAELASNPNVILTRSQRTEDGPAVASRWLWRLRTLAKGALGEDGARAALQSRKPYLDWAQNLDFISPEDVNAMSAPLPKPALHLRWPAPKGRELAVTRLTQLVRDPYAHYARTILKLPKLDPLDDDIGALQMGIAVHDSLEDFARKFGDTPPENGVEVLADMFAQQLSTLGLSREMISAERPRLMTASRKFMDWFNTSRAQGWHSAGVEVTGELKIDAPQGCFTLTAKSDRIDQRGGSYQIVDYKTGNPPSANEVKAGFDLQLPLQAAMLAAGGFNDIRTETEHGTTEDMVYLSLKGFNQDSGVTSLIKKDWTPDRFIDLAIETITKLIAYFDDPEAAYHAQPRIKFTNDYGDYDHLSRRAEWAKAGDENKEPSA